MATVIVCDAPSAKRTALAARLAALPQLAGISTVDTAEHLLEAVAGSPADLVLLATGLPQTDSAAAVAAVLEAAPDTCVLMLTLGTDPDVVADCVAAGAVGYLAKDAAVAELAAALAKLPAVDRPDGLLHPPGDGSEPLLTERELQVLRGMSRGRSNSQIGADLFLSEDTIKTHARRLYRKMNAKDRAHAVAEGIRRGLLH
jgi:DNA-binding NarL/FixJ family response regulator